ncbi:UNKNOWN [Stylonychia lemnae]|uniref:Transmembrane protein n=1 Tax=Stylonychia lemnae TaxID=5949 RepID=A0A078BBS8_STYLE|nr:UNKNOWN [Stylonychia lemnae]|eukprot:CDW91043.1 UNKNOWN [Stylonychia lemnae]
MSKNKLSISFKGNGLFRDKKSNQFISYMYETNRLIPRQIYNDAATKALLAVGSSVSTGVGSVVYGTFAINILLKHVHLFNWNNIFDFSLYLTQDFSKVFCILQYNTGSDQFASIFAIALFVVMLIFPFAIWFIAFIFRNKLNNENIKERIDYESDIDKQYFMGWQLIAIVAINIIGNITLIVIQSFYSLKNNLKIMKDKVKIVWQKLFSKNKTRDIFEENKYQESPRKNTSEFQFLELETTKIFQKQTGDQEEIYFVKQRQTQMKIIKNRGQSKYDSNFFAQQQNSTLKDNQSIFKDEIEIEHDFNFDQIGQPIESLAYARKDQLTARNVYKRKGVKHRSTQKTKTKRLQLGLQQEQYSSLKKKDSCDLEDQSQNKPLNGSEKKIQVKEDDYMREYFLNIGFRDLQSYDQSHFNDQFTNNHKNYNFQDYKREDIWKK